MRSPQLAVLVPLRLDREILEPAIDRYLNDEPAPIAERAEVAVYLDRREEARELVDEMPSGDLRDVLTAELDLADGSVEAARERLFALGEPEGLTARVRLDLGVCAQSRSDWRAAVAHAEAAMMAARREGDRCTEGRSYRLRGVALSEIDGQSEQAEDNLREAVVRLTACEDLKHRAAAEITYARRMVVDGRAVEAARLLDSADATLYKLGLERLVQSVRHARAWADLVAGEYQSALDRALRALPVDRAQMSAAGEGWALHVGALAATFAGRMDAARDLAESFLSLRRIGDSAPELVEAHIVRYRVRARAGDRVALEDLDAMTSAAEASAEPVLHSHARLAQADAWLGHDLARAFALREALPAVVTRDPWSAAEMSNLDARWSGEPVRREGARLVVDFSAGLPCRKALHAIADFCLVEEARARTASEGEAARLICETPNNLWEFSRKLSLRLGVPLPKPRRGKRQNARS